MWAAKALKLVYRWVVGDGKKIRFWADIWFETSPLSVQFWPLYSICHQHFVSLAEVWDNNEIKLTFRRNFSDIMMEGWLQLVEIVHNIVLSDESDALIWQYENFWQNSSSSLYAIINYRGVVPVFLPRFGSY